MDQRLRECNRVRTSGSLLDMKIHHLKHLHVYVYIYTWCFLFLYDLMSLWRTQLKKKIRTGTVFFQLSLGLGQWLTLKSDHNMSSLFLHTAVGRSVEESKTSKYVLRMKCYHHVDQKSSLKNQNPDQQSTYALQSIWEQKRTMSLNQVFPWVNLTNYQKKQKQNRAFN